jgi:hypothetical protein
MPDEFLTLTPDDIRFLRLCWKTPAEVSAGVGKLMALLDIVRPLYFESGEPEFPFYCGGSCFVTRCDGHTSVFTAQH